MAAWSRLLPLILIFIFVAILIAVGMIVYAVMMDVKSKTKQKMQKKQIALSRDGVKVGVKDLQAEEYQDRTQSILVNVWEAAGQASSKGSSWRRK
ncbi:hypothetical protein FQN57_006701 [Myotisia sp. PD_48]|nr:hypothetical protein FQN57_006701 [Myotisia sp. PD_48]